MIGKSRLRVLSSVVTGFVVLSVAGWWMQGGGDVSGQVSVKAAKPKATVRQSDQHADKPLMDDDFSKVLAVFARGGSPLELALAIEVLDTHARVGKEFPADQHAALLAAMERGTPGGMGDGSWSHLFNSGCNALAAGRSTPDEAFIRMLERITVSDHRLVMRLYALQHIGVRYETATPECQLRLKTLVKRLLDDPESRTAGTALVLWRHWENTDADDGGTSFALSKAMVEDVRRPLDVRVTALQAIADDPDVLDIARAIAPDSAQPIILRKAALNLLGRHGQERDLTVLRQCSQESPRLAQAGNPAATALENRLNHIPQPVLTKIQ